MATISLSSNSTNNYSSTSLSMSPCSEGKLMLLVAGISTPLLVIIYCIQFIAWAISATTIAALLAVVCIIIAACLFTLLKMYHNGMNKHSSKGIHNILQALFVTYILLRDYRKRNRDETKRSLWNQHKTILRNQRIICM
jgi:hypothetical protein